MKIDPLGLPHTVRAEMGPVMHSPSQPAPQESGRGDTGKRSIMGTYPGAWLSPRLGAHLHRCVVLPQNRSTELDPAWPMWDLPFGEDMDHFLWDPAWCWRECQSLLRLRCLAGWQEPRVCAVCPGWCGQWHSGVWAASEGEILLSWGQWAEEKALGLRDWPRFCSDSRPWSWGSLSGQF